MHQKPREERVEEHDGRRDDGERDQRRHRARVCGGECRVRRRHEHQDQERDEDELLFCWQEGEAEVSFGHPSGEDGLPRRPLRVARGA